MCEVVENRRHYVSVCVGVRARRKEIRSVGCVCAVASSEEI